MVPVYGDPPQKDHPNSLFSNCSGASTVPPAAGGRSSSRSSFVSVADVSDDSDLDLENI